MSEAKCDDTDLVFVVWSADDDGVVQTNQSKSKSIAIASFSLSVITLRERILSSGDFIFLVIVGTTCNRAVARFIDILGSLLLDVPLDAPLSLVTDDMVTIMFAIPLRLLTVYG